MNEYQVIRRPIVTEKSTLLREKYNRVTFEVHPSANKIQIRRAIEEIFHVKVREVRTLRMHGKQKRVGRNIGRRADWKKAVVTLAPGERIDLLDGV